jgi:hypothetical protein
MKPTHVDRTPTGFSATCFRLFFLARKSDGPRASLKTLGASGQIKPPSVGLFG